MTLTAAEIQEALTEGTRLAISDYLDNFDPANLHDLIHDAIKKGVIDAFPFPTEITNAITEGIKEATEGRRG